MADLLSGTIYTYIYGGKKGRASVQINAVTEFLLKGILTRAEK